MCLTSKVQKKKMDRSRSPAPEISRDLFQEFKFIVSGERPTRPSLDEDAKSFSSSSSNSSCISVLSVKSNRRKSSTAHELCPDTKTRKLGSRKPSSQISNHDQENEFSFSQKKSVSSGRPKPRGLSERDRNVFRFSNVGSPKENLNPQIQVPRISVSLDTDDVFLDTLEYPASSRLLLTPSTTYSPRPSSCTSLNLEYSPNIALGIKCNTPSRLKLELEGLEGAEKLVLGRGAYGTVVLGQWKGEKCAVKVMEKEQGVGVSARRRKSLESELQALKLEHENIVKVHGVFAAEERYSVIIMEYVGSRNLHRLLIETPDKVLGRSWLLGVGKQISSALNHCHSRGVVHMDIKPANVLVTSSGVCKLGDFGCSVGVDSGDVPLDHSLVGTPGYQAPEFLRGGLPHPLCDVYSFGILLWQLDSREVPFQGQHPQTIMFRCVSVDARPSTPTRHFINLPGFKKIYLSCWSSDVNDRPTACTIHSRLVSLSSSLSAPTSARSMTTLRI